MTTVTKKTHTLIQKMGSIAKKEFYTLSKPTVYEKSRIEFVTSLDKKIHRILSRELPKIVGVPVLSEESTKKWKKTDTYWVIDPIDGTTNFITRIPYFCIGIGLVMFNEITLNVILNPITNELFYAEKDGGAFLNGNILKPDTRIPLHKSIIGLSYSHSPRSIQRAGRIGMRLRKTVHNTRHSGSTLLTLAYVAAGRLEASVMVGPVTAWDSLPGLLLIKEVGGKITDFAGKPYKINATKNIITSNSADHTQLAKIVSSIH